MTGDLEELFSQHACSFVCYCVNYSLSSVSIHGGGFTHQQITVVENL